MEKLESEKLEARFPHPKLVLGKSMSCEIVSLFSQSRSTKRFTNERRSASQNGWDSFCWHQNSLPISDPHLPPPEFGKFGVLSVFLDMTQRLETSKFRKSALPWAKCTRSRFSKLRGWGAGPNLSAPKTKTDLRFRKIAAGRRLPVQP